MPTTRPTETQAANTGPIAVRSDASSGTGTATIESANAAMGGVVHLVDGVLQPVTSSLTDLVSKDPSLSTLKTRE